MIRTYTIENTETTYLRIWQKINLGKEVLEPDFFKQEDIKDSSDSLRLKVFQYDQNTRVFCMGRTLYMVTSESAIYNYLDTGRAVTFDENKGYYNHEKSKLYFYNDLIITDTEIINFENYKDKVGMNLKAIADIDKLDCSLIFNEDLVKIKNRIAQIQAEEKEIENQEKQEKIKGNEEEEKLESLIRQYDKMTILEDKGTIIKDNYFIDKDSGFKIEFRDKVVNIFKKEQLVRDSVYSGKFIEIGYEDFLNDLERCYQCGKYDEPIEKQLENLPKKWLRFKVYSYDPETKAEVFLKEVRIENKVNDKGKSRFTINGIKIPIQKMRKAIEFIRGGRWSGTDKNTLIHRLTNLEDYLEKIRLFSGTQLELLEGKTIEIKLNGLSIPINFNFTAEDKENWQVNIDTFSVKRGYKDIKTLSYDLRGGGLSSISGICDTLKAGKILEDILIGKIQGYVEKRRLAEERAENLFNEFLEKNKTRVFKKEGGYIVKGKLKNYLVKMKDEENCGVWTFPANDYVCIEEKTKEGKYLCKFDKLLQFCICMLNDGNLREQIYTIH